LLSLKFGAEIAVFLGIISTPGDHSSVP
jgi:hypothetical protein